jgi:hypothetical protein
VNGRIVVCGAIAQKAHQAGHTWQFLQYLLGFRELGWDVLFVDRLHGDVDPGDGRIGYVRAVMRAAGLDDAWTIGLDDGCHAGLARAEVLERVGDADLLLNVMGFCEDVEILGAARERVFLDTDPGFGQMWHALGLADIFAGHDRHVTIGERIGTPDCAIPTCGIDWITTPQPVVLSQWPAAPPPAGPLRFTSVARWRGAYGPIDFDGRRYGLRLHQFRRFAQLPRLTGARLEVALDIDPTDEADIRLLDREGWILTDPTSVAATPASYSAFIRASSAELLVAKGMYVDTRSGWLSERSLCYLASGRPVLAQSTGAEELYPTGCGLVTFATVDEAVAGVDAIRSDYARHAQAARDLAAAYFDATRVLGRLLDRLGSRPAAATLVADRAPA